MLLPINTHAQTSRHEISFGGGPSLLVIGENKSIFRNGGTEHNFTSCVFSLCYNYNVSKHVSFGCMMRFNGEREGLDKHSYDDLRRVNHYIEKYETAMMTRALPPIEPDKMTYHELVQVRDRLLSDDTGDRNVRLAIVPSVRLYWFNNEAFGMYSKIGAGMLFTIGDRCTRDKSRLNFAFYGAPIGMEGGNDKVRGYLEISLGLEAGVKINLPYKRNKKQVL